MDYSTFISKYGIYLNEQQEAALTNVDGQTLLLAVPGSGKTTTLVCRVGYMIYVQGIDPSKILVLTFTRAAARDMLERFVRIFGDEYAKQVRFRTINSLCEYTLNKFCQVRNHMKPKLLEDNYLTLFRLYQQIYPDYPAESDIRNIQLAITRAKNLRMSDAEIRKTRVDNKPLEPIYAIYQKYLRKTGQMDYDDQLVFAYTILSGDKHFLNALQDMNPYILVDEAQDTSRIQHEIINLLAGKHRRLFMVGDEDQSIYGFRAAYPDALMQFNSTYPDAKVLMLERNYRSTPEIVSLANAFIKQNKNRYQKNMFTVRASASHVKLHKCNKREDQYYEIAHELLPRYDGETAVIYRNNESAIPLIAEMMKSDIPFRCKGMDTVFFSSRVVRDICKILKSALEPFDTELFLDTYSMFNAHVSKRAATNAVESGDPDKYDSLWYAVALGGDVSKNYRQTAKQIAEGMAEIRKNDNAGEAIDRIIDLGYKRADDDRVFILRTLAGEGESIESFISRLGELEELMPTASHDKNIPYVLTTVHSSKGLEYDNVIIMDEISPVFPDKRVDIEEERRLFYVAMTRAKDNLTLLSYGNQKQPFIDGIEKASGARKKRLETAKTAAQTADSVQTGTIYAGGSAIVSDAVHIVDSVQSTDSDESQFKKGAIVMHKTFGSGKIINIERDTATIRFDKNQTVKTFSIPVCIENRLFEFKS